MKPEAKILVLMLGLTLPCMGFVWYRAFAYPQHPFPNWFLYGAPCYFLGSIVLLVALRKKIVGDTPPQNLDEQTRSMADIEGDRRRLKLLWIGTGTYCFIFLNGLRLGLENAGEVPLVVIILAEVLNGAFLATIILILRKVYKRVQQADRLASDR